MLASLSDMSMAGLQALGVRPAVHKDQACIECSSQLQPGLHTLQCRQAMGCNCCSYCQSSADGQHMIAEPLVGH